MTKLESNTTNPVVSNQNGTEALGVESDSTKAQDRCDAYFSAVYPWCTPFKVSPEAQHRALAMEAIAGIIDILNGNFSRISFLRIVTLKGRLKIYLEFGESGGIYNNGGSGSALNDFLKFIEERSLDLKGVDIESVDIESNNVNTSHHFIGPSIEVLPEASFNALERLIEDASSDATKQLKSLAERIEKVRLTKKELAIVSGIESLDALDTQRFPNFIEFFDFLKSQLVLTCIGDHVFRLPPILLIGDPGIGKTEVLLRLAEVMGTDFMAHNMATAQNGCSLGGSDIMWSNSRQGELFNLLVFGRTANPVVMLDEIDKVSAKEYSPLASLYGLLERRTAAQFVDLSLPGVKIDASHVVWFAAANDARAIEPALLSRFMVFHIPIPTKNQMPTIIKSIYSDLIAKEVWGKAFSSELSDDIFDKFDGIAPRHVKKILVSACAKATIEGRREILPADINIKGAEMRIGFLT